MKADLTRITDQPAASYRAVRLQQGRVQLDADFNEQQDILQRRIETETVDSIGATGAPIAHPGFELTGSGKQVQVSAGRFYVDGLLCSNPAPCTVVTQPWLPFAASPVVPVTPAGQNLLALPPGAATALAETAIYNAAGAAVAPPDGLYIGYLEAWVRHVTALEDPVLREVALGGPDTATREQLLWQVKLLRAADLTAALTCITEQPWKDFSAPSAGRLAARAEPGALATDPCDLSPEAGYRRLDNQLYRVEVHDDGSVSGKAIFKWQRDNGSIVSSVTRWLGEPNANEFEVASLGRDDVLAITVGCWLEFFDDRFDFLGRPGTLVQVTKTDGRVVTINPATVQGLPLDKALFARNPRVRRWDGFAAIVPKLETDKAGWVMLEGGVEVKFIAGKLRVGDNWTIPARTATARIEWPTEGGLPTGKPLFLLPQGVRRAFARLAVLKCQAGVWTRLPGGDCRPLFPALTELTQLQYVGGDGQQALPNTLAPATPVPLPSPLEVAVVNGRFPVTGATVRYTVSHGLLPNGTQTQDVPTSTTGIAGVAWSLAANQPRQTATAVLLQPGVPAAQACPPLHFSATLALAAQVAYQPGACSDLAGVNTVQAALDLLCQRKPPAGGSGCCKTVGAKNAAGASAGGADYETLDEALRDLLDRGERDICICLLPGDHQLKDSLRLAAPEHTRLLVHGAGRASRLHTDNGNIVLTRFETLTLRDFEIISPRQPSPLRVQHCGEVRWQQLSVRGVADGKSGLCVLGSSRLFECSGVALQAISQENQEKTKAVAKAVPSLQRLFDSPALKVETGEVFMPVPLAVAEGYVKLSPADAKQMDGELAALQRREDFASWRFELTDAIATLKDLVLGIAAGATVSASASVLSMAETLGRLRDALVNDTPGQALGLLDTDGEVLIADSQFAGHLVLGGELRDPSVIDPALLHALAAQMSKQPQLLRPAAAQARLRNNRLRSVWFSNALVKLLEQALRNEPPTRLRCWTSLVADANTSDALAFEVLAASAALSQNTLLLDPSRQGQLGLVLALRGVYLGNVGTGRLLTVGHAAEVFGSGLQVAPA
jgi:hypothetical protein